ncbi:MAG TPA: DUF2269 family protein [Asticcacaulis sp.]|nr:DUF2269 family protein [Asticcacaulis sp.]
MLYLCVKWLHILSSTVLFGTGIGTAFFMLMANWGFTTPAVIFQPLSGLMLMHLTGIDLQARGKRLS